VKSWLDNYVKRHYKCIVLHIKSFKKLYFSTRTFDFLFINIVFSFNWQNIPRKFGNRHFDLDKKRGDIHFQVLNEGVWTARFSIRKYKKGLQFELTGGWKAFAEDNNLKVGDVCKFELISSTILNFIVHIFRETNNDNTSCSTSQSRINWFLILISNYFFFSFHK